MKNLIILILSLFVSVAAFGQDDPAKLAKKASKALSSYNIDPAGNVAKLDEARAAIEEALKNPEVAAQSASWQTLGDVYNAILSRDMAQKQFKPDYKMTVANPAFEAFKGYSKAFELGQKKFEKKEALKGLTEIQPQLSNLGVANFQASDFDLAFNSFDAALKSHDLLKSNGEKTVLEKPEDLNNVKYLAALAAQNSKRSDVAMKLYEELYKSKYNEAAVYEGLAGMKIAAGAKDEGAAILAEGRKAFPEDSGLLFAEINYYLRENKLDQLTAQLKEAIKKEPGNVGLYVTLGQVYDNLYQREVEPGNVGLYVTLGQVYDNLYQREVEAKNDAKAAELFAETTKYYGQALEKDSKNVDAIYSLGAIYYNKAALLTKELNSLPEDNKAETQRKYDSLKKQIFDLFDQALPYFKRAESLDANDKNTLIALKEIFAKRDELEISLEMKKRLEKLESGVKNEKSYFQN